LESKNIIIFTASSDKDLFERLKNSGVKVILKKPHLFKNWRSC
jgi:AmiR/NasT family two-component response regulator